MEGRNDDGASTSNENKREKRKGVDYHNSIPQKFQVCEIDSENESDFSTDGTEDQYIIVSDKQKKKLVRVVMSCKRLGSSNTKNANSKRYRFTFKCWCSIRQP